MNIYNEILIFQRKQAKGYSASHGLGHWSEQSFESGHHAWKVHQDRFKVGMDHAEYGQKMLEAALNINAENI